MNLAFWPPFPCSHRNVSLCTVFEAFPSSDLLEGVKPLRVCLFILILFPYRIFLLLYNHHTQLRQCYNYLPLFLALLSKVSATHCHQRSKNTKWKFSEINNSPVLDCGSFCKVWWNLGLSGSTLPRIGTIPLPRLSHNTDPIHLLSLSSHLSYQLNCASAMMIGFQWSLCIIPKAWHSAFISPPRYCFFSHHHEKKRGEYYSEYYSISREKSIL